MSGRHPLHVSFVWHMHQPYYKDALTGHYRLPWVRLHGTKDYLDMVEILRDFPAIRQTFNLVPSLLEQLVDYAEGRAHDTFLDLSRRRAADLTSEDKVFILENFFLANWENMIKPFPRYYSLLVKRGARLVRSELSRAANYFSDNDFLDLQVLFNLCWIDPLFRSSDPFLKTLSAKGHGYTEEEKSLLLDKHAEILGRIIPTYRQMSESGQVELSFTPFFHPILPLLCDTDIARVAMPGVRLPRQRFAHPEDAERQIELGLRFFEDLFGRRPAGMWPSEGSVSEEVLRIVSRCGIKWVATDEAVLARSLDRRLRDDYGNISDPAALYRPYRYADVSIFFRDHGLSDLIGFVYSQWEPRKAAEDFISKLLAIRRALPNDRAYVVPVILDGENAWEYYKNDGRDFFLYLYEGLTKEERLKTVTATEFIDNNPPGDALGRLHPGSWINANYGIWIGHEEDNLAWDYLAETRAHVSEYAASRGDLPDAALKALYAAEGSDWNWWYGDDHTTETQEEFDELFRRNLIRVFKELGKEAPSQLYIPILREDRGVLPTLGIRGFIEPVIDGIVTSYYEWYEGAQLDVRKSGGSMHKSDSLISTLYFGFNREKLFVRIDPKVPVAELGEGLDLAITTSSPSNMRIIVPLYPGRPKGRLYEKSGEGFLLLKEIDHIACQDIFECGIYFSDLCAHEQQEIHLHISIRRGEEEIERCPWRGYITITVPTEDFEAMMWY